MKHSWVLNLLLLVAAILVLWGAYKEVSFVLLLKKEEGIQHAKVVELQRKKEELELKLLALEHPEGVAREAKERLNLKKMGEEVVVVIPEVYSATSSTPQFSMWQRILKSLASVFSF